MLILSPLTLLRTNSIEGPALRVCWPTFVLFRQPARPWSALGVQFLASSLPSTVHPPNLTIHRLWRNSAAKSLTPVAYSVIIEFGVGDASYRFRKTRVGGVSDAEMSPVPTE